MILMILGIVLLFGAILYAGRQANIYIRLRNRMGKLVFSLSPSGSQRKFLIIATIAFVVMLGAVTMNYVSEGIPLNYTYSMLLALVIFSGGRFCSNIVELREKGILGNLEVISYDDVKYYKIEGQGKRQMVKFHLKDGQEFVSLGAKNDMDNFEAAMKKMQGKK